MRGHDHQPLLRPYPSVSKFGRDDRVRASDQLPWRSAPETEPTKPPLYYAVTCAQHAAPHDSPAVGRWASLGGVDVIEVTSSQVELVAEAAGVRYLLHCWTTSLWGACRSLIPALGTCPLAGPCPVLERMGPCRRSASKAIASRVFSPCEFARTVLFPVLLVCSSSDAANRVRPPSLSSQRVHGKRRLSP